MSEESDAVVGAIDGLTKQVGKLNDLLSKTAPATVEALELLLKTQDDQGKKLCALDKTLGEVRDQLAQINEKASNFFSPGGGVEEDGSERRFVPDPPAGG